MEHRETLTLANAQIVLPDAVVRGAVQVEHGVIARIDIKAADIAGAVDLNGDYLIPGLIEVHTDNLERHIWPRPGVEWNVGSAVLSHDLELAGAGITTAYDAISIGNALLPEDGGGSPDIPFAAIAAAQADGLLRAEHRIHLRCELSDPTLPDIFPGLVDDPLVGLVSLMDHTPGQRQWIDLDRFRSYYGARYGLGSDELDQLIERRRTYHLAYSDNNRRAIVATCQRKAIRLASHDDATPEHIAVSAQDGVRIAEFPTTVRAARAAREAGQAIVMGAPNLLRGRSHSGNVSAGDLVKTGCIDILSSDYCPSSLIQAVFSLPDLLGIALPKAILFASAAPALALGLSDRGEIAVGRRGDLVRVRQTRHGPSVRAVWRGGHRVV